MRSSAAVLALALLTTLLPAVCFPRHLVLVYPLWALLAGLQCSQWTVDRPRVRYVLYLVVLLSAVYTGGFANVYREPPTTQQAAEWLASRAGRVTSGPPCGATWLLPRNAEPSSDLDGFELAVVPDRLVTLFEDWSHEPERYGPTAWFPATDVVPTEVLAFQREVRETWLPVARCRVRPGFGRWRWSLADAPPPFGRLTHPDLTIYARPNSR